MPIQLIDWRYHRHWTDESPYVVRTVFVLKARKDAPQFDRSVIASCPLSLLPSDSMACHCIWYDT